MLNKTIDKLSREITTKRITIDNLKRLNANPLLINKMDEIRKNRDLVKTMVDEYIDKITIFRLHELWLLVVVSYKGGEEMWGTIKCARYKKEEMFYSHKENLKIIQFIRQYFLSYNILMKGLAKKQIYINF